MSKILNKIKAIIHIIRGRPLMYRITCMAKDGEITFYKRYNLLIENTFAYTGIIYVDGDFR